MAKPPSEKQLALIVQLAEETGTTLYKMPDTAEQAMHTVDRYLRWRKAGTKARNRGATKARNRS